MAKIDGLNLVLRSGKRFRTWHYIGIRVNETDDHLPEVSTGYDGNVSTVLSGNESDEALTREECFELADFMLAQWAAFRLRVLNHGQR